MNVDDDNMDITRSVSSFASDQRDLGTCWAHAVSRVMVRHLFKNIPRTEPENMFCNSLITNYLNTHFFSTLHYFNDETYQRCSGGNRETLLLFVLFYKFLINKHDCKGNFSIVGLTDLIFFMNKFFKSEYMQVYREVNIYLPIHPDDFHNHVSNHLKINKLIKLKQFTNLQDVKTHLHEGNYLLYNINGDLIIYLMGLFYNTLGGIDPTTYPENVVNLHKQMHHENLTYNHAVVIVCKKGESGEWFAIKNSWGDKRLIWFHASTLVIEQCAGIEDQEQPHRGGYFKRPTKKQKNKKQSFKRKMYKKRIAKTKKHSR